MKGRATWIERTRTELGLRPRPRKQRYPALNRELTLEEALARMDDVVERAPHNTRYFVARSWLLPILEAARKQRAADSAAEVA